MILFDDLKKVGSSRLAKSVCLMALCLACLGQVTAQNVIYVDPDASDGDLVVYNGVTGEAYSTLLQAVSHATATDTVKLLANVTISAQVVHNGYTLDGNGHTLTRTGPGSYGIFTHGGTIRNLTVNGASRGIFASIYNASDISQDIIIDNCIIDKVLYTFNVDGTYKCDHSLIIRNSTLNGWTSYSDCFQSVTITNCDFGKGTGSYTCSFFRPYGPTVIEETSFSEDFRVDPSVSTANILFNDCEFAGIALSTENLDVLLSEYVYSGTTYANGVEQDDPTSQAVVVNGDFSQNAEGEITAGIYGGNLDVLNSMCADGYRGVPIPGTDPQQYLVTPIYYIHFNSSGGTGTMESVYVPREAPKNVYTVPACTFTHTVPFKNWTTLPNGGGTDVAVDAVMTLTSDTTLYAKWSCVAMIGNTPYATLPEAITAATSGATITIVDNITPDEVANITLDKSLTITAETPGKYTLTDHHFTLSGAAVEATVSNLNFAGNSYINANDGKSLTVDHVNATVHPDKVTYHRGFIVLKYNELTTGLSLTLTNNLIVDTAPENEDCACIGWRYIQEATITGNTFGSVEYPYIFTAVKLMNTTDNAQVVITDNVVYGKQGVDDSESSKFWAFDLYRNNSRANSYNVVSDNNKLYNQGTHNNNFHLFRIECNTLNNTLGELMVTDNGSQIDDTPVELGNIDYELGDNYTPVTLYGVDVVRNDNDEITEGTFNTNTPMLRQDCATGYAAFANGTDPETYTIAEAYSVVYNANKTPQQDTIIYIKKSVAEHTTLSANTYTNGELFFDGWNTQADGTGTDVAAGATMSLNSDTTLYAQWQGVARIGTTQYLTLDAAAAAVPVGTPTTITILRNLNFYDIASSNLANKTITFTGTRADTLTVTDLSHINPSAGYGSDLTFENITLKHDPTADNYQAIINVSKITCNDCEILGYTTGYAETVICNNCTFTQTTGKYHLWTYGSNCTFNSCTFNTSYNNGKAVNVFKEGALTQPYRVVTFNDCSFNAPSNPGSDRSAIQINSSNCCYVVNVNNCEVNGYHNEESTAVDGYKDLINNKSTSVATTLYVDGTQIIKQSDCDPVAMIGDTYYGTLQGALDAAYDNLTGDVTIELIKDINGDFGVVRQKAGQFLTIEGNDHTLMGQIIVTAYGTGQTDNTSLTVEHLNFTMDPNEYTLKGGADGLVFIPQCDGGANDFWKPESATSWWQQHGITVSNFNNYTHNITVRDCTFDLPLYSSGTSVVAVKSQNSHGKVYGIVLENLSAQGGHSFAQLNNTGKSVSDTAIFISNCTYTDNTHNGINITGGDNNSIIVIRNTDITTLEGYALRVKDGGSKTVLLSDNNFSTSTTGEGIVFNNSNPAYYYFSSGVYDGLLDIKAARADSNILVLTGGTYSSFESGALTPIEFLNEKCATGYAAYEDEGSSPQSWTVTKMNMLTFNANGGTGTMDTLYLDPRTPQTVTVPACSFTYTGGIEFLEWNTKADGTGDGFDPTNGDAITGITSDTVLYAQWDCVAMIDDMPFGSIQAAVDAARASMTGDVIVKLLKDVTAYTLVRQKEGLDLTIDGQNHFLRGQIMIDGDGRSTGTDSLIIKNVKFEYDDGGFHASTPKAFVYFVKESGLIATSGHNYAHNVLVQNCSFDGLDRITYYPTYAVFSPNGQGGIYNITLDHLYATNVFTPALMNSTNTLTITNYKADEVTEGINIPGGTGNITLDYDTISAELYALRIRDNGTRVANIDNSQFVGANSILTGNSGTLNIAGGRYDGPLGYHTGYDADNDATVYSITGGTFNEDVTKKCAEGYAAFANGTTPETWTVYAAYKVKYVANNGTDACDSSYVRQSEGTVVVKACDYTKDGYTFLKWNKQADGSGSNVAPGVAYPLTADITFYAQWGLNVVYNVDQDIYYAALSTALNEANPGDTLRLLENLDLSSSVEFSQDQTIDLNTKTINSTVQYAVIATDGKVNIKNGTINSNKTYAVYCDGTAKLNIVDCNVNATQYTVVNNSTDTLTFTNGTIVNTYSSSGHYTIQNKRSGVIMVSGVTIPDGKNYLVDNVTTGTIKLNNHCNITGGDYVVRNNAAAGKIYIDNSTITGTASYAYVVYPNNGGQMYISNSEINAPVGYCVYVGGSSSTPYVDINNCTLNAERRGIQNATIGRVDIHGNTTITLNSTNQAQYGVYQSTAGTLNVGGYIDENDNLVADGTVTITINPSISGTNCGAYVSNGVLNIFGNTQINAAGELVTAGVYASSTAKVNIMSGTINVPDKIGVVGICDSLVIGKDDCTGPTITAKEAAISHQGGHLVVKGGTLTATDGAAVASYQSSASTATTLDIACGTLSGESALSITNPNNFTSTNVKDSVYGGTFNGTVSETDDRIEGFITGGTFDGGTVLSALNSMCAPGYTAFANGTTPETWTVDKAYVLIYNANGAEGTMDTVVVQEANKVQTVLPCAFTFGTMPFINWNTKADGTGTTYTPVSSNVTLVNPDTTILYAQWDGVAKIGARSYPTLQAAVDAANASMTGDVTIDLVKNTSEYVEVLQVATNNLTINGNGNTLDGQMFISAKGENWDGTDWITVTDMNFTYNATYFDGDVTDPANEKGLLTFCKNCGTDRIRSDVNYAHNITISNCNFDADGSNQGAYAIASIAGSVNHLVIDNCTAKNAKALASLQSDPQFVLTNCQTEDVKYGVRIVNNDGPMTVTGNNFQADEAGILVEFMTSGATINFANDTVNAPKAFMLSNTSTSGNLEITSGLYMGDFDDNATSDFFNISGGTYSVDVTGEPCAEGYAAFANGTTPETWTVDKAWFLYYDKNEVEASGTMDTIFVRRNGDDAARTVTVASCDFTWLPYHTFDKWNNKAGGDGNDFAPGDNIVLTSDTTLFALWKLGYTVFYHNNGGTGTIPNQSKNPGVDIVLSDGTGFSKPDSTLYRWNTQADESGTPYALGAIYSEDANLDLYAVWRLNLDMTSTATDVVCYGQNNGTDTVKIIGGEAPYQIVLSGGALTDNVEVTTTETQYIFTGLKPSTNEYKVQLTDVLTKDTIRASFTISQPDTLVITAITVPERPCPLMGTGTYAVSMTTTGGNGGNTITWGGDATDANALATTITPDADDRDRTYNVTVTVTDSKGCMATGNASFSVAPVIANDGSAHSNTTMTIAPISKGILTGCDTIIRDFGTPAFVFTNPAITEDILDTIYNNVSTVAPDSIFVVGTHEILWTAIDTCGHEVTATQVITITHAPCPSVEDFDHNVYPAVRIGCDCWTAKNLSSTHYSDGREIQNVMHYPVTTRATVGGNLYDWYATVDTLTNSVSDIEAAYAADESVQGICPEGWHVPTEAELNELMGQANPEDLMSLGVWIPNVGTNATGFDMYPAGCYNSSLDRYERMYVSAYFWILTPPTSVYHACEFGSACSTTELIPGSLTMGYSVRCVLDKE